MAEARVPNPLVDQFVRGGVPRDLRLVAAQGALPLKPADLLELLHHLLSDADGEVKATAHKTLMGMPADELVPVFQDKETLPAVLAWGLRHRTEGRLREVALQNVSTPDQAVESVASSLSEALAELVVINQMRLLRSTPLLVALEGNPGLNNDQKRRLRELRETFRIGEAPEAPPPPPPPAPEPEPEPVAEEPIVEEAGPVPQSEEEAISQLLSEDERKEAEKVSAVQRVFKMNTAEKVITALKGTREERSILIRDRNRLVATAVLGSPKLTDAEIEGYAAMKNISDEILRKIGNNREWTKRYPVVQSLVKNPRTPIAVSIGLVSRLNPRDLKGLTTDRNVSEVIRKQAQKFVKGPAEKKH